MDLHFLSIILYASASSASVSENIFYYLYANTKQVFLLLMIPSIIVAFFTL